MTLWSVLDLLLGKWDPVEGTKDSGTVKRWWHMEPEAREAVLGSLDWLEVSRKVPAVTVLISAAGVQVF